MNNNFINKLNDTPNKCTRENTLVLFDVDGTLAESMKQATPEMLDLLAKLRKKVYIGIVGGSDLNKQKKQLNDSIHEDFDYIFSQNGLEAYKGNVLIGKASFKDYLGEEKLKKLVNFILRKMADIDIPIKRGTFIEYRSGMLNISLIGRNCSQQERDEFDIYDKEHNVRKQLVKELKEEFKDYELKFSIGGQISIDIFPEGWDKTYCLQFVEQFEIIHFFGDRTQPGGNDHEIYEHPRTIGHSVKNYKDTMEQLLKLFDI